MKIACKIYLTSFYNSESIDQISEILEENAPKLTWKKLIFFQFSSPNLRHLQFPIEKRQFEP